MKTCNKCGEEKELSEFGKLSSSKDGLMRRCKECDKIYRKEYYDNNHEKSLLRVQKHRDNNREKIREKDRQYIKNNPEIIYTRNKKYYDKNKDIEIKRVRIYQNNNQDKIKEKRNNHVNERYKTDIIYKLKVNMRNRIRCYFSTTNFSKNNKTFNIVGCTPEFLKEYIENKFIDSMKWENHGLYGWHIDHIIPLSSAKTEEEIYKLCHYTNLQPLWGIDNYRKGNNIL